MSIKLKSKVKDSITGLEGIAITKDQNVTGCVFVFLQPQAHKDGVPVEGTWFSENRLVAAVEGEDISDPEAVKHPLLGKHVHDCFNNVDGLVTHAIYDAFVGPSLFILPDPEVDEEKKDKDKKESPVRRRLRGMGEYKVDATYCSESPVPEQAHIPPDLPEGADTGCCGTYKTMPQLAV